MADDAPAAKRQALEADVHELRAAERRMQRDMGQHRRRESSLVLRLALKEREHTDLQGQIGELRTALQPSHAQTTTLLLDPAVNAEIMRLREEVKEAQRKEKEAQDQLQASQFQSGSIAGKKLIQKCKELQVSRRPAMPAATSASAHASMCPYHVSAGGERPVGKGSLRGACAEAACGCGAAKRV